MPKKSKEELRLIRNAEARKRRQRFADLAQQQASLKASHQRQANARLEAESKATGKTIAQLIVEQWSKPYADENLYETANHDVYDRRDRDEVSEFMSEAEYVNSLSSKERRRWRRMMRVD